MADIILSIRDDRFVCSAARLHRIVVHAGAAVVPVHRGLGSVFALGILGQSGDTTAPPRISTACGGHTDGGAPCTLPTQDSTTHLNAFAGGAFDGGFTRG